MLAASGGDLRRDDDDGSYSFTLSPVPYPPSPFFRYSRSSKLITHFGRYTTIIAITIPFTNASPKLISGNTEKYSGPTWAASSEPLAASSATRASPARL